MTLYNPAQPRFPRVGDGRRRFDILTIGLHWATVTLIVACSPARGFCWPATVNTPRCC